MQRCHYEFGEHDHPATGTLSPVGRGFPEHARTALCRDHAQLVGAAASKKLRPTVRKLQRSALQLLDEMIEVGD